MNYNDFTEVFQWTHGTTATSTNANYVTFPIKPVRAATVKDMNTVIKDDYNEVLRNQFTREDMFGRYLQEGAPEGMYASTEYEDKKREERDRKARNAAPSCIGICFGPYQPGTVKVAQGHLPMVYASHDSILLWQGEVQDTQEAAMEIAEERARKALAHPLHAVEQ